MENGVEKIDPSSWVSRVVDGDTVVMLSGERIRLIGIDAPEMKQPYGEASKAALHRLIFNNENPGVIIVKRFGEDRYGRTLGELFTWPDMEVSINREMVARGYAWYYPSPEAVENGEQDPHDAFNNDEIRARLHKWGLWADDQPPERPKAYRRRKREEARRRKKIKNQTSKMMKKKK